VWHDYTIRSKLDLEKKICIMKDGKTLCLASDETDETNQFRLKPYEGNALKNHNYSANPYLYITAQVCKKGANAVAIEGTAQTWWFTK
jgi:hypothetical protein